MANDNHLLSVTCYNVTMLNTNYYNDFFELGQQKINFSGEFLGNTTDSFESRALAPHSEGAEIHYYQLTEDCTMTAGEVAPWFGSEGGAEQFVKYKSDGSKYTIKELEDAGILEDITDLVEKGEIKID